MSTLIPPRDIVSVNVNMFKGDILLTCTYSPDVNPEAFAQLRTGRDVFSFCPELHHLDKLGFKLCTVFRLGRLSSLYVLTKDGSPHSMQIPLMVQEAAENVGFDKSNIRYYCLEGGKVHEISDLSVRKARHYSEIERLLPYAKLEKVTEVLRGENGCPNDQKETFSTILDNLKEEIGEIEAALKANDMDNFIEEVGDVLFNVALVGEIAKERGLSDLAQISQSVAQKMIDRHPNVFKSLVMKY